MAYPTQNVFRIDHAKTLNLNSLIKSGFVIQDHRVEGVITWNEKFKINASVEIRRDYGKMKLKYKLNSEVVEYDVEIISKLSNLDNKSLIWYFVCQFTNEVSRKLYFNGKHFIHRRGITGLYDAQTKSKKTRESDILMKSLIGSNNIYAQIQKKHLKKNYKGGLTKIYRKLLARKRLLEGVTAQDILRGIST